MDLPQGSLDDDPALRKRRGSGVVLAVAVAIAVVAVAGAWIAGTVIAGPARKAPARPKDVPAASYRDGED